jgi:D-hexose-6-phosphate mutarotase
MIELVNGQSRTTISPEGAWVESLETNESAILFPKTELTNDSNETKTRGGMHVCLPNFGPGGESGLTQHGFGRTSLWEVTRQTNATVTLQLEHSDHRYHGVYWSLHYALEPQSLTATLSVQNNSQSNARIAPGFHPYFYLEDSETAIVANTVVHELQTLSGTKFDDSTSIDLKTGSRSLRLEQKGLPLWAIWTDQIANYVCVEPTFGGYRFLELATPDEQVLPGDTREFSFTISW